MPKACLSLHCKTGQPYQSQAREGQPAGVKHVENLGSAHHFLRVKRRVSKDIQRFLQTMGSSASIPDANDLHGACRLSVVASYSQTMKDRKQTRRRENTLCWWRTTPRIPILMDRPNSELFLTYAYSLASLPPRYVLRPTRIRKSFTVYAIQ